MMITYLKIAGVVCCTLFILIVLFFGLSTIHIYRKCKNISRIDIDIKHICKDIYGKDIVTMGETYYSNHPKEFFKKYQLTLEEFKSRLEIDFMDLIETYIFSNSIFFIRKYLPENNYELYNILNSFFMTLNIPYIYPSLSNGGDITKLREIFDLIQRFNPFNQEKSKYTYWTDINNYISDKYIYYYRDSIENSVLLESLKNNLFVDLWANRMLSIICELEVQNVQTEDLSTKYKKFYDRIITGFGNSELIPLHYVETSIFEMDVQLLSYIRLSNDEYDNIRVGKPTSTPKYVVYIKNRGEECFHTITENLSDIEENIIENLKYSLFVLHDIGKILGIYADIIN